MYDNRYPTFKHGDYDSPLYYVEFDRGFTKGTFTLFRRQFILSKEDMEKLKKSDTNDSKLMLMCCEGHGWNIMTDNYGPDGSVPDKKWVCWMVDALNEKLQKDLTSS